MKLKKTNEVYDRIINEGTVITQKLGWFFNGVNTIKGAFGKGKNITVIRQLKKSKNGEFREISSIDNQYRFEFFVYANLNPDVISNFYEKFNPLKEKYNQNEGQKQDQTNDKNINNQNKINLINKKPIIQQDNDEDNDESGSTDKGNSEKGIGSQTDTKYAKCQLIIERNVDGNFNKVQITVKAHKISMNEDGKGIWSKKLMKIFDGKKSKFSKVYDENETRLSNLQINDIRKEIDDHLDGGWKRRNISYNETINEESYQNYKAYLNDKQKYIEYEANLENDKKKADETQNNSKKLSGRIIKYKEKYIKWLTQKFKDDSNLNNVIEIINNKFDQAIEDNKLNELKILYPKKENEKIKWVPCEEPVSGYFKDNDSYENFKEKIMNQEQKNIYEELKNLGYEIKKTGSAKSWMIPINDTEKISRTDLVKKINDSNTKEDEKTDLKNIYKKFLENLINRDINEEENNTRLNKLNNSYNDNNIKIESIDSFVNQYNILMEQLENTNKGFKSPDELLKNTYNEIGFTKFDELKNNNEFILKINNTDQKILQDAAESLWEDTIEKYDQDQEESKIRAIAFYNFLKQKISGKK